MELREMREGEVSAPGLGEEEESRRRERERDMALNIEDPPLLNDGLCAPTPTEE